MNAAVWAGCITESVPVPVLFCYGHSAAARLRLALEPALAAHADGPAWPRWAYLFFGRNPLS